MESQIPQQPVGCEDFDKTVNEADRLLCLPQLFGGSFKGRIKIFAEKVDEWGFEELIDADFLAAAVGEGVAADVPAVEIQGRHTIGELGDTNRVEAAGDGLAEVSDPLVPLFLDCAQTITRRITATVGTLLRAGDKWGDEVAVNVDFKETFLVNGPAPGLGHHRAEIVVVLFKRRQLAFKQRSTTVAYHAAYSIALGIVTGKIFGQYFTGDENVVYLDYRIVLAHKSIISSRHTRSCCLQRAFEAHP